MAEVSGTVAHSQNLGRKKLVVLGTGFGSLSMLYRIDKKLYDTVVISPRNHFLFTPLLPSTTVGTLEFRSILEPVRESLPHAVFYQAEALSVDPQKRVVECRGLLDEATFAVSYDLLVIGVGAVVNTYNIPGVKKHTFFLKEVTDARNIRQAIVMNFERAAVPTCPEEERRRLLTFTVVGGGPVGVEFAAELHDLLVEDLAEAFPTLANDVRILLFEATDQILSAFDTELSAFALRHFKRNNIEVRTHMLVTEVREKTIHFHDGTALPYGLCVWSTGIGPNPFVARLPFERDKGMRIIVDEYFRVKGYDTVYALGDCALVETRPLPALAQAAMQSGIYLGKALNKTAKGGSPKPFTYNDLGLLAYIGGNKALADLHSFKGKGFLTVLFWRSVYFTRLVRIKNKILVVFDWFKTLVFGRDISRL